MDAPRGKGHVRVVIEGHNRIAVGALADALSRGGRELGPGVPSALGKVTPREEPDGAQQGDRDRAAIVQDRILAKAVDSDRESLGRALHRDEVVQARLRCRWLDPPLAHLETVRALEQRERRTALMRERARTRLAKDAQAVIAGAVVDLERDVDPPLAGVERDLYLYGAVDELGRSRGAVIANARRKAQNELDRGGRAIAGHRRGARPGNALRSDGRPGVGIGVFVPTITLGYQPVLAPATFRGRLVDDEEAPVGLDLHAQETVLDRGAAVGAYRRHRGRDHGREAQPAGSNAREASVDRYDGFARPRQRIPEHRYGALPCEPLEEPGRECPATLTDVFEAGRHIDVVDRIDRAAADRVVRVVLQEHPPEVAQVVARRAAGERVERLAPLEEKALARHVLLLDPDAR